ncbi:MAG: hypothetical protein LBV08_07005 [Clostridiales bacterium]|nr:hypothetical protein [Clostridiales bacterium]
MRKVKLKILFLSHIFLFIMSSKIFASNTALYKIKFNVTDNYGTNLSGIKFQVFNSESEARASVSEIKKGTFKEKAQDILVSDNGVVTSGYMPYGRQMYFIQVNVLNAYEPNYNVYNFNIYSGDKYLTQQVMENGRAVQVKNVLKRPIELTNKYKIKLTQVDASGVKIAGAVYNIYNNIDDARIAKNQFLAGGKVTHADGLIEAMPPTNGLGITMSAYYYSPGIYYIVQTNAVNNIYMPNPVGTIEIYRAEIGGSVERVYTDTVNYYYVKKIEPSLTAFRVRNRVV